VTVGRGALRKGLLDKGRDPSALSKCGALFKQNCAIGMKSIVRIRASGAMGSADSSDAKA
jgi:hypothetical protein